MRYAALLFVLTLPIITHGQTARGDRITRAPSPPRPTITLGRIPDTGYAHVDRVALPQLISTPLVPLAGGRFALGLVSPHRVGILDASGHLDPAPLDRNGVPLGLITDPITQPLQVTPDGAIVASGTGGVVFLVTPDGAVRNTVSLSSRVPSGTLVRSDGSLAMTVVSTSAAHELVVSSPDGSRTESRALAGPPRARPVMDARGDLLVSFGPFLGRLDARGRWSVTGFAPNVADLVVLDDGSLAAVAEGTVLLARATGEITARVELGLTPIWLAALPGGRVAALKPGPPNEMWVIDPSGRAEVRAQIPIASAPPMVDATGAMLVITREGDVLALEPDGSTRWHMALNEPLRTPAVPLPGGGFAVATSQRSVIFVR